MSRKLMTLAAAVAMAVGAATSAQAAGLEDIFTVRGYATLGVVHSDEDQADFTGAFLTKSDGAGFTDEVSLDVDSKFGVQLDINITPRLSGVVQLVSESSFNNTWNGDVNEEYRPSLEWANLSYKLTDDITVRAGRIVLPFLMISEYRKVGFANHWLRAPVEVYGQIAFNSSDGADVSYRSNIGGATNTVRVHYGAQTLRTDLLDGQVLALGFMDTLEIGALSLRVAYMDLDFKAPKRDSLEPLFNPFIGATSTLPGGIGASAAAEATRMLQQYDTTRGNNFDFFDIGAIYDPGQWFVMAEALRLEGDGFIRNNVAGYVSGGYRWNQITPYATFAKVTTDRRMETGIPLAGLPAPLAGLGGAINGLINTLLDLDLAQQSVSLGVRWDVANKFALKTQYDRIEPKNAGLFSNVQPGFVPGSTVNLFSIALDYVF